MAGVVVIPWYATVFRGDDLAGALAEIAPLATRYGATEYDVLRSTEDRYKFTQFATFETKLDWERYWEGDEFSAWRARYGGWFQVPVLYSWHDRVVRGGQPGGPVEAPYAARSR